MGLILHTPDSTTLIYSLNSVKGGYTGDALHRGVLQGLLRGMLGAYTMGHMKQAFYSVIWGVYIGFLRRVFHIWCPIAGPQKKSIISTILADTRSAVSPCQ